MKKLLFSLCLLAVGITACKKTDSEPQMPAPTHDGRRVVAWKLDGKVYVAQGRKFNGDWAANGGMIYLTPPQDRWYLHVAGNYIGDQGNAINRVYMELNCPFNHEVNQPLTFWNYPFYGTVSDMRNVDATIPTGSTEFLTDSLHRGTMTVTYEDSTTISGTFKMDVVNDEGKVLHITDGIFDLPKYR